MQRKVQIVEPRRLAFDRLRKAIEQEVNTVFGLDDLLPNDQLFALVLAKLGQETLDTQLRPLGCFPLFYGDLVAFLLSAMI